jgi:hypothetical protein
LFSGSSVAAALPTQDEFIAHVQRLAAGEASGCERQRRRKLAERPETLRRARKEQPVLLVEAPVSVMSQQMENLPEGVVLRPGEILINFDMPNQALEKLPALAMAVGNDQIEFERIVAR